MKDGIYKTMNLNKNYKFMSEKKEARMFMQGVCTSCGEESEEIVFNDWRCSECIEKEYFEELYEQEAGALRYN